MDKTYILCCLYLNTSILKYFYTYTYIIILILLYLYLYLCRCVNLIIWSKHINNLKRPKVVSIAIVLGLFLPKYCMEFHPSIIISCQHLLFLVLPSPSIVWGLSSPSPSFVCGSFLPLRSKLSYISSLFGKIATTRSPQALFFFIRCATVLQLSLCLHKLCGALRFSTGSFSSTSSQKLSMVSKLSLLPHLCSDLCREVRPLEYPILLFLEGPESKDMHKSQNCEGESSLLLPAL